MLGIILPLHSRHLNSRLATEPLWVQGEERGEARGWRGGEGPPEGLLTSILPQAQHILLLFTPCGPALLSFSVCSFASWTVCSLP